MKRFIILLSTLFVAVGTSNAQKLNLKDCIAIGLQNNINLKIAKNNFSSADYDKMGSYNGILPTISLSAGSGERVEGEAEFLSTEPVGFDSTTGNVIYAQRTRKNPKSSRKSNSASLRINETLFDGGIWWNQIHKASIDRDASNMDLISARQTLIRDIEQAYLNLLKNQKLYDVYKVAVQRSQEQLDRTQKMYEIGSKAKLDVYQAKVNLGNDKINMLTQKNTVSASRRDLNIVLGRTPSEPIEVEAIDETIEPLPALDDLIRMALENQPLVQKNKMAIKSREISTDMSRGILYPRLSAYYNYDRFNEKFNKIYSNFNQNYSSTYGLTLSLNIFNGLSDYTNIQKSKIAEANTRENATAYERKLKSAIYQYYENYTSYNDIIAINKENLEASKEELRLANERYRVGSGTALDVREAQVKRTRAEETYIAARYNALINLAQLDSELGIIEQKIK